MSSTTVGRLLHRLGYRLQSVRKRQEGTVHPDRNEQFEHINATADRFLNTGQPVISVDTKKKELVGNFANAGREWQPKATPPALRVHDFPSDAEGKAIPYGVFDMRRCPPRSTKGASGAAGPRETRRRSLARYASRLPGRPVDQIDRPAVPSVLGPVYRDKPATGKLWRGWVRGVLAPAQALGHVDVNAAGAVIDAALPKTPKTREHRRALPYADVPAALEAVEASGAGPIVKATIRFTALTAVRSGEARGATWGEVDLEVREWRVPASRMKAGAEHRVPRRMGLWPCSRA